MRLFPTCSQVIPVFPHPFGAALTSAARVSLVATVALPIIGALLASPLLATTRFGSKKPRQNPFLEIYFLTPLAAIGTGLCILGLASFFFFLLTITCDGMHMMIFHHHALHYPFVFFPMA